MEKAKYTGWPFKYFVLLFWCKWYFWNFLNIYNAFMRNNQVIKFSRNLYGPSRWATLTPLQLSVWGRLYFIYEKYKASFLSNLRIRVMFIINYISRNRYNCLDYANTSSNLRFYILPNRITVSKKTVMPIQNDLYLFARI